MSVVADKLRAARALVERGWTQEAWARDAAGKGRFWDDPSAVSHCARGAIWSAAASGEIELAFEEAIGVADVAVWNDAPERTQAEVLAAFDKAIALAEQSDRSELLNQVQR